MPVFIRSALILVLLAPALLQATPQFARKYDVRCTMCHSAPPKLNQTGEDFLARGYRLEQGASTMAENKTLPVAVWATGRGQWDMSLDRARGLINRVEIISAGPIAHRAFYFVEWVPVSQEVGANGARVERHGRFEDLLISVPLFGVQLTVGQYRAMQQIDVSRRLSISEPLAFSTGVAGTPALSTRLTGLRSFSLSGRSPSVRVSHHWATGGRAANGWYNSLTVPLAGEFVIPLTSRVHRERGFEFEANPKGVVLESFYKYGLSSLGGHAFVGDSRRLLGVVGSVGSRKLISSAAVGFAREISGSEDTRFSWETDFVPIRWATLGFRIDDRTGPNRPVAYIPYTNLYFPLRTYTARITAEHRQQRGNRQWLLEAGVIF